MGRNRPTGTAYDGSTIDIRIAQRDGRAVAPVVVGVDDSTLIMVIDVGAGRGVVDLNIEAELLAALAGECIRIEADLLARLNQSGQ
ncbi:hypothetical protein D3C72_2297940 [compost metagenome]